MDTMETIPDTLAPALDVFARLGEPQPVGAGTPFLLAGGQAWQVVEGTVDVFAVELRAHEPVGARAHLLRAGPGAVLFAVDDAHAHPHAHPHADAPNTSAAAERDLAERDLAERDLAERGLLAVGASGTLLRRVPLGALRAHGETVDGARDVVAAVEGWAEALYAGLGEALARASGGAHGRHAAPRDCRAIGCTPDGAPARFDAGTSARPTAGVAWVRHLAGHSHLLGVDELAVNGVGFTPVSHRAWLEAREPGEVLLVEGLAINDPDALWAGVARLHALVLRGTAVAVGRGAAAAHERLARRAAADRRALQGACARLADTLDPRVGSADATTLAVTLRAAAGEHAVAGYEDALLAVCQRVGEAAGVTVRPYVRGDGIAPPRDPLAAIARASRLRTRQVVLRDAWWAHDHGPLLARVAAPAAAPEGAGDAGGSAPARHPLLDAPTPRPVALIPAARGRGYTLHDPFTGRGYPVGLAEGALLEPFAHTFYRPFPARALSITDVARFGLRGCGRDLALVTAVGAAGALLGLVPPMATGALFSTVIPGAQRPQLVQLAVVLLVCALATALFNVTRAVALLRVEGRMGAAVQAAVWDRLLALPMPFFRPYSAGDLAVRAMGIDGIRQVVSGVTVTALLGGLFSLVNFALMFSYSPRMAWWATLLIAVAVGIASVGSWLQLRQNRRVAEVQARVSGLVLQLLTGVTKLRVAGAEARAFTRWATRFGEQRRLQFRAERVGGGVSAIQSAFPVVANMVIFWAALGLLGSANEAGDASSPRLTTGDFLAFLSAYAACQGALLSMCTALLQTLATVPLYEQARPILATAPEVDEAKSDPGPLAGAIELRNLYFRYNPEGAPVLRDVSLRIEPGEFVAFVGPSGSGKSTILRLLLGFERAETGTVLYDGQELEQLDVQEVRRQIGVVLQNGQLMSGDIFTNIAGSSPASLDDAWEAARMAGFDADVKAMPMGMHTVVSEGGGTLSGGQRQRLMIARAVVHRPRLMFFDEATSALDNRTQAVVTESLDRLKATRIVVAHRLSTIVHADRIVVVERGRVVQQGRYDELMAQPGLFAELARRQIA